MGAQAGRGGRGLGGVRGARAGRMRAAGGGSGGRLGSILRRKQEEVQEKVGALSDGELQEALALAPPPLGEFWFSERVGSAKESGKPLMMAEVRKSSPGAPSEEAAERVRELRDAGWDCVCVRVDSEFSHDGQADLEAVLAVTVGADAASSFPVFAMDWVIHPIQLAAAAKAGCAGVIGCICQILGPKGGLQLTGYAAGLGISAPLEVLNLEETAIAVTGGVPEVAINVNVGISLKIPGFQSDIAANLVAELPADAPSYIGVKDRAALKSAYLAGGDVMVCKHEYLVGEDCKGDPGAPLEHRRAVLGSSEYDSGEVEL